MAMMMMMMMITINSIQQVFYNVLAQQHKCQFQSRTKMCKKETQNRKRTCDSNEKQYSKLGADTKAPYLVSITECQNLFE
jgi:hypothetical protein